jgi:hypothetical protein
MASNPSPSHQNFSAAGRSATVTPTWSKRGPSPRRQSGRRLRRGEVARVDVLVGQVALDELQPGAVRVEEEGDAHVAQHVHRRREHRDAGRHQPSDLRVDVADLHPDVPDAALQVVVDPRTGVPLGAHLGEVDQHLAGGETADRSRPGALDGDLLEAEDPAVEVRRPVEVPGAQHDAPQPGARRPGRPGVPSMAGRLRARVIRTRTGGHGCFPPAAAGARLTRPARFTCAGPAHVRPARPDPRYRCRWRQIT